MRDTVETLPDAGDDAVEIAALACLTPMAYGRCRVAEAKRLGVPVATLDSEVTKAREALVGTDSKGRASLYLEFEPWPEPVTTAQILDEVVAAIRRHLIMSAASADVTALWNIHTYVYQQFEHTPRLVVLSPEKRCGKSTLLDVLHAIGRKVLKCDNITTAATFRLIERDAPTLLLDEADSFLFDNEGLRGVLNSGYQSNGCVPRTEKTADGELDVTPFSTFAPVAIAAIAARKGRRSIPDTIMDRAVPIMLARRLPGERVHKMRLPASRKALEVLARRVLRWSIDTIADLSVDPQIPDSFNDRQGDICVPLLSIADHAGEAWGRRARASLAEIFGVEEEEDPESPIRMLADVRAAFEVGGVEGRIFTTDLLRFLIDMPERPWGAMNYGKPIRDVQLSDTLKTFKSPGGVGIRSKTLRIGGERLKGYEIADFADAFARYLPPIDASPSSDVPGSRDTRDAVTTEESPWVGEEGRPVTPPVTGGGVSRDTEACHGSELDRHGQCHGTGGARKAMENLACHGVTGVTASWHTLRETLHAAAEARSGLTNALARVLPGAGGSRGCAEPGISLSDSD